jgi:anti-anti-sigma factor
MPLTLSSRHVGNVYVVECKGRISGDEAKTLDAVLQASTLQFSRLVLNVSEVDRLDSMGIGLLVRHATNVHKHGGDIRLAAPPLFIVKLLNLTNLSNVLRAYETEEDAILSFLKHQGTRKSPGKDGPRVLFFDQSPDLCAFVRTVLDQHGFDVKSTSNFGDAKILLRVDDVEYVLVGPGTAQLSSETALRSLKPLAPRAAALSLDKDFKSRDAHEATEALLRLVGIEKAADAGD